MLHVAPKSPISMVVGRIVATIAVTIVALTTLGTTALSQSTPPDSARASSRGADSAQAIIPAVGLAIRSLSGRVTSALDGRGVVGAEVLVIRGDTLRARTNAEGRWQVPNAEVSARYELRVRAMGFIAQSATRESDAASGEWNIILTPAALSLDQVVVSAARREQRLADAVATVEVVSRSDLERSGASDLSAVLTEHTGIELQGGHPAGAGAMLQGIGSERVLVLLDGAPLAGRLSGNFDLSRIPVAMVERVEVVKGAQSTLYGSEAMGGVINIISRRPSREFGSFTSALTGTVGAQGRRDGAGRVTLARGNWASSIDVARRSQLSAPGVEADAGALAARLDAAAKLQWRPDSNRSAELSVLALDERQRWRSGTFYSFSDNAQLNARLAGAWQRGAHRIAPAVSVSNWDHTSYTSAYNAPIAGDTGARQLQRIAQGELLYNGLFRSNIALDAGVQLRVDEIETERVPGGLRSHTSVEPFAQLEYSPTRHITLMPGLRLSQSNVWGTQLTPRIAARAQLSERITLRASVGDGFRAPDFKELYLLFQNTNAGYAVQGNPDLRPESSRNAMLGVEYAAPSGYLRTQLFHNAFTEFIESEIVSAPNEAAVYRYNNRDNGYTRGAEIEAGGNLVSSGRLRAELGFSLLETRDNSSGKSLLGRPARSGRAALSAQLPLGVRSSVAAVHTGRTPMQRDADTQAVSSWRDAFTRMDVRFAKPLQRLGLEFVLGADNVLDARPAEWAGFTGRHIYSSLTYTFSSQSTR
jgi:outer membrane receptor for ferrienterochelin and colicins